MSWLRHRQQAYALANYWDELVRKRPAVPVPPPAVPPGEGALVRQMHLLEEGDERRPDWQDELLRTLLASYQQAGPAPDIARTTTARHVTLAPTRVTLPHAPLTWVRRNAIPAFEIAMVFVLLLASAFGIWLASDRSDEPSRIVAPEDATPRVPMYRGNPARTGVMEGPGIDGAPVVLLEADLGPDASYGVPALAGDTLYLGGGHRGGALAIDRHTGETRWDVTGGPAWGSISAPVVVGDTLYFVDFSRALLALDAGTGAERWRVDDLRLSMEMQPLVADGVVYVGAEDGHVYALDAASGTGIWQRQLLEAVAHSAALANGVLFLGTTNGQIHALRAGDGAEVWQASVDLSSARLGQLAVANGLVYITADNPVRPTDAGFAMALDAATGVVAWRIDAEPLFGFSLLAVDEATAYLEGPDVFGTIQAVDALTGVTRWTSTVDATVDGDPALVDDTLYIGSMDGVLHALDATTGIEAWSIDLGGELSFGPIVADGIAYICTSRGTLYAITGSSSGLVAAATPETSTPVPGTPLAHVARGQS